MQHLTYHIRNQMQCALCDMVWDVNDPQPPICHGPGVLRHELQLPPLIFEVIWRHRKRGTYYQVVGVRRFDCAYQIVYSDIDSNEIFYRPVAEFFDGRFEVVTSRTVNELEQLEITRG